MNQDFGHAETCFSPSERSRYITEFWPAEVKLAADLLRRV